jgi:hypothetical protein
LRNIDVLVSDGGKKRLREHAFSDIQERFDHIPVSIEATFEDLTPKPRAIPPHD